MQLPFQPACRPLLLGSLPYRSASQALSIARRYAADVLVWPHLPQRSFRETSVVQSATGFPGLVVDAQHRRVYVDRAQAEAGLDQLGLAYLQHNLSYSALDDEDASGLSELHRQRDSLKNIRALKTQLMGPISLAAHLTDEDERPLVYDETLFEALTHHLYLRAAWQSSQMAELCGTLIVCLDEPFLDAAALPFLPLEWDRIQHAIKDVFGAIDGCRALYIGGAAQLRAIVQTECDLLIANALAPGSVLFSDNDALAELIDRDGLLGLGVVPTSEEELARFTVHQLADEIERVLAAFEPRGLAIGTILSCSFLTTQDSIGQLAPHVAEQVLETLAALSREVRERFSLE